MDSNPRPLASNIITLDQFTHTTIAPFLFFVLISTYTTTYSYTLVSIYLIYQTIKFLKAIQGSRTCKQHIAN